MGWVVYDTRTLLMEKYYKKAATARRIVTQHNTPGTTVSTSTHPTDCGPAAHIVTSKAS